jgi:hypothetical protein
MKSNVAAGCRMVGLQRQHVWCNQAFRIIATAQGGYQQDAALATERFGEFYWKVVGDQEEAAYRICQAIKY